MMKYEVYQGSGRFTPFTADELDDLEDKMHDLIFDWVQENNDKDMFALDIRIEVIRGRMRVQVENIFEVKEDGN
ncbi:MAG: hypothetical protein MJY95_00810 [Bacteroidaceae bacterium]|nr:hypothetical protein [Bacteroidaceae bacterium]